MFKAEELKRLGFERVVDGGSIYYQYLLKADDYFNSPYLATIDLPKGEKEDDFYFEVENNILENVSRSTLLRNEVISIIELSK